MAHPEIIIFFEVLEVYLENHRRKGSQIYIKIYFLNNPLKATMRARPIKSLKVAIKLYEKWANYINQSFVLYA